MPLTDGARPTHTDTFDLQSRLDETYSRPPQTAHRPVIAVTANHEGDDITLREVYCLQIVKAGGVPLIMPPCADESVITSTLEHADAVIFSGGGDHNPLWQHEQPMPGLHSINRFRDLPELLTARLAFNRQVPMMGICRGIQTIAIALGGHVRQDIGTPEVKHSQDADRSEPTHTVSIATDSILHDVYQTDQIYVNSFHHQAVDNAGLHLRVTARSADGIVEAVESSEHKPILGVQWHPEWLADDGLPLFEWLVEQARWYSKAKETHRRTLTLDTHCDTPMFFPEGIDIGRRDPRILVDLHKMTEGRQDAVTMVAYLPQPKPGEAFSDIAPFKVSTPKEYADLIFDKLEAMVRANSEHVRLASTPGQLYANKAAGVKSIVLGIENGLALEHDLDNVNHFAARGVTYITLCHNGNNDICGSARYNDGGIGVTPYGERVIQRMNACGVMVDLSHGGERSFYDALDISRTPIVCSHSNAKALCDVPRNLTDDQMRALARKGGVAHITLYHGFLRKEGEASIHDAMAHLDHAVKVMGIEHTGLGTDFDGDGGIKGLADSSELINFTIQLLRRRYSQDDIEKIWGGNWLRVMRQVQAAKTTVNE